MYFDKVHKKKPYLGDFPAIDYPVFNRKHCLVFCRGTDGWHGLLYQMLRHLDLAWYCRQHGALSLSLLGLCQAQTRQNHHFKLGNRKACCRDLRGHQLRASLSGLLAGKFRFKRPKCLISKKYEFGRIVLFHEFFSEFRMADLFANQKRIHSKIYSKAKRAD